MLLKVATCFALLTAVSALLESDRTRLPQICPDLSPPIVCITFPCDPCPPKDVCSLPSDSGPCEAAIQRWFFNKKTNRCEEFIYGGCQGNKNNFQSLKECESRCGSPPPPTNICFLPPETGFCKARIERWFFNKKSGSCEKFIYGGCGGNKNNFETREKCVDSCGGPSPPPPTDVCKLPKEIGPCDGSFPRYFFNSASKTCEKFFFGGCGGNKNNFETLRECQKSCGGNIPIPIDICKLPAVTGPCRAAIPRWFFNSRTGRCERFTYGGCQGNKNNFETIEECKKTCGGSSFCVKEGLRCTGPTQCCNGGTCCSPLGFSPGSSFSGICTPKGKCFLKG